MPNKTQLEKVKTQFENWKARSFTTVINLEEPKCAKPKKQWFSDKIPKIKK